MTTLGLQKTLAAKNKNFDTYKFFEAYRAAKRKKLHRKGFQKKSSFAPSTLVYYFGRCPKYWQLAFAGAEFDHKYNENFAGAMENGTDRHTRIESIYEAIDDDSITVEIELEVKNDSPPIRGYLDALVTVDGVRCIDDIKTINSSGYTYCENSMKPKQEHVEQLLVYMKILGVTNGMIHYENKDSGESMMIPFALTQKQKAHAEYMFEWMTDVYEKAQGEKIRRPFEKASRQCTNCPVRKACWSDEDGTVEVQPLAALG